MSGSKDNIKPQNISLGGMRMNESSVMNWDGPHSYFYPDLNPELLLPANEPAKCKIFGCGRSLTLQEQLLGNICCRHPRYSQELLSGGMYKKPNIFVQLDLLIRINSPKQYRFEKKFKRAMNKK